MDTKFKKGQHVVCKYHGDNGDLVVGRIESVRSSGEIVLYNLVTGGRSLKSASVLGLRNVVVPKVKAVALLKYANNKKELRERAVALADNERRNPTKGSVQLSLVYSARTSIDAVVQSFRALSSQDQARALEEIRARGMA